MATEIIQINSQDFTSQTYEGQDVNLISTFDVTTFLSSSSYIEFFIYDNNQNILSSQYNFFQYTVLDNGQSPGTNDDISQIEINPEENLTNLGYDQGQYITYYNFFNKQIGSELQQLYISEISSDRTEIRLDSTSLTNEDIVEQANNLIQLREDSPYFLDFYLNFGDNQLSIANNIQLDDTDPNNPTILIKLYEALPDQFDLNSTLWVVTNLEESIAYQVTFQDAPIIILDTVPTKGPNFNLDIKDQINNSTLSYNYTQLTTTSLTSSYNQLNSLLEEKEIDINIDYTNFNNFTHFSSIKTRLENFYYKISLIENYSSSIAILNNTTNNNPSASLAVYEAKINDIITNFDGYDYYLYYSSGSWAWPKSTSQPPYALYPIGTPEVLTWYGSDNEFSPYYGGIILSASIFDNNNSNNLYYSIPEYLRDDPANDQYSLFVEMVGQFYDNIWVYYKDVTEKYNADNRLENGVSKDIVADAIRDFGIKLYQNNFSNEDLYTAFLGLTPEGALFPFPNITGSLPTPTGFEYVDTLISASNDYMPLDDVNKSLYKRIYHNLPYLLKAKGTLPALRALITSYGIPDTILRINEYGGKDRVVKNDWDYWQDTFNYAFYTTGSNYVSSVFGPVNPLWYSLDDVPNSVALRFKTNGLPIENIPASQSLWNVDDNNLFLNLRYTGSGYLSSSLYPGSIPDPYNQYAYLDFYPNVQLDPSISASIYLPFFNGEWWSVVINRDPLDSTNSTFTLYAGNKVYEGGDNGTSIGFFESSSLTSNHNEWITYGTSNFAKGPIIINGSPYESFSGSLQEIRYYTNALDKNIIKNYIMNPHSIQGNSLNSSPEELIFRASLGGELYTGLNSIHPKVTGSWGMTSSFNLDSTFTTFTTPVFNPNTEYFFYDQPAVGIKNAVSDKIRIEDEVYPSGNTLSPFRSLAQNVAISSSYTANTNLLEVAFSPQDEINEDIMDQMGFFNIGEFIGDPRLRSSSAEFYPALNNLRDAYFEKYTSNYDLVDYIRLIKFFDNSLFKMIKDFVPARASLASGVVIKQHILERNKYPQPQVDDYSTIAYTTSGSQNNIPFTFQDISVSGTVAPQWNDYNPGTIENFSGGTGGTMDMFNGINTSPYGPNGTGPNNILNLTQSWNAGIVTPLGIAVTQQSAQDEFYDGEFSGSILTVTTKNLAQPYPLDNIAEYYKQVHYYGTGSNEDSIFESYFLNPITSPQSGSILFYNEPTVFGGSPSYQIFNTKYLKIAKIDCSGSNNTTILGDIDSALIYNDVLGQYVNYDLTVLNEYPTYYLYQVDQPQPYVPSSWPNQIFNYYTSGSKTSSQLITTPLIGTYPIISNYQTELGDILNYFNLSTGLYTLGDTPNTQLIISASITNAGNASAGSGNAFIEVLRNGVRTQLASSLSFTTTSPTTVNLATSYYGLVGDQIYVRATKNGVAPTTDYTVTNVQLLVTQSRAVSSSACAPVIFEPYITQPDYYYSDYNPIMNNIEAERLNTIYEKVDYYPGITTPTNFDLIISGSALKAAVQDSNYTSKRVINPRYNGVKSTNQFLNVWTPGDSGNYGKTPSTQNLKTMVAYCDWIGGWPPDKMNASAIHIQYLIKSDGSIVIPNVSDNSLFDNKGTFESGERLIIEPRTISSGLPTQYRNIIRGGTRIEPILYTQIGHTPPNWTSSLNLWNDNVNYPVSDVTRLSVLNPFSSGNPIAQLLPFPGATQILGTTLAGASQGWTILYDPASTTFGSGNYDYSIGLSTQNPLAEGTNLIVDTKIKLQNFSTVNSSVVKIQLRNSFVGANSPLETQLISLSPNEIKTAVFYRSLTPGVDYNDTIAKGDIHFLIENDGPSSICAVLSDANETYFNVKQNPLPNPLPPVLTGSNRIWNYPTSSTYNQHSSSAQGIIFIPDTTSSLNIYYNTPGVHQSDITQSGFNSITLDWSVKYGDEFRFEGVEDRTYTVKQVFEPTDQSSERISNTGSLEVHLDKALPSQSINLDHFLIRRYVDDASVVLMEGFKPINTSGPYIVRPEYLVPELNKRVDEFILDLTQKGLL
jgi:hypothetical protein